MMDTEITTLESKLTTSTTNAPNIYAFQDYREFVIQWFDYLKSIDPHFSLRALASRAGLSPGYLPSFLAARIGMSANALGKILPFLKISTQKKEYLKLLRTVCESEDNTEREDALNRLIQLRQGIGMSAAEIDSFRYMSRWYMVAIREMITLHDFKLDAKWIRERLKHSISLQEIEEAIQFLLEKKFIEVKDGIVTHGSVVHLSFHGGLNRLVMSRYHDQMLELSQQALSQTKRKERAFLGHTFALTVEQINEIRNIMGQAIEQIKCVTEEVNKPKRGPKAKKEVYHLELALFPLTHERAEEEDSAA